MTILSVMQARIADDLARPDITNQIADAINDAIAHYQSTRFYFTETRTASFSTVAGQELLQLGRRCRHSRLCTSSTTCRSPSPATLCRSSARTQR